MENFSILPIAMKVAAKTIALDLVSVSPMGNISEEMNKIKKDVSVENRDRKISAIVDGKEFQEMKVEEHPTYNSGPKGQLFYLDFKYNDDTDDNDFE